MMYRNFGSDVTVITPEEKLLSDEDSDIAEEIGNEFHNKGINIINGTKAEKIEENNEDDVMLTLSNNEQVTANAVLLATGRIPNKESLGLESTSIELTQDGAIKVGDNLETTADNVWALDDVRGGFQFTNISLDDYRIVMSHLLGDKSYSLKTRENVPYTMFADPPFFRVGMTKEEADKNGFEGADMSESFNGLFAVEG